MLPETVLKGWSDFIDQVKMKMAEIENRDEAAESEMRVEKEEEEEEEEKKRKPGGRKNFRKVTYRRVSGECTQIGAHRFGGHGMQ